MNADAPSTTGDQTADQAGDLSAKVEAALLTLDRSVSSAKLAEALGEDVSTSDINQAVKNLNSHYEQTGRSFRIETVAGGFKVLTLPQYSEVLASLHKNRGQNKLTAAQLETLAIIAYKQPIVRAEVEAIRGAGCGEQVRVLMDHHLVKITGRAEEVGRPMLYGTTRQFLTTFGLASTKDLPKPESLARAESIG